MRFVKSLVMAVACLAMISAPVMADKVLQAKTRLDKLAGTQYVVVVSYVPSEITSITCDTWVMLGVGSWKHQNDFTIPAAVAVPGSTAVEPTVAVIDANKYQGYCDKEGSIIAHTDDGDFVGHLDRGAGNWNGSTKLTFLPK